MEKPLEPQAITPEYKTQNRLVAMRNLREAANCVAEARSYLVNAAEPTGDLWAIECRIRETGREMFGG